MSAKTNLFIALIFVVPIFWTTDVFAQPTPLDTAYVDGILLKLPSMPDDTTKVNHYSTLAAMYTIVDPALAVTYAKKGAVVAEKIGFHKGRIICLAQSAFAFAIIGEWAKSYRDLNEAIPLADRYDSKKMIYLYNIMYINAATKGDLNEAMSWAKKALNHPLFSSKNEIEKWPTYMQIGRGYAMLNVLDSAIYYDTLLAGFTLKYGELIPDLAQNSLVLSGDIAFKQQNYSKAIEYYRKAGSDIGLADSYFKLNNPDSTTFYAKKALENAYTHKIPTELQRAAKVLADSYKDLNPSISNYYLNLYIASKDSLFSADRLKQLELVKLNEQKNVFDLEKSETSKRNLIILLSLVFILLVLIFSAIVLWRSTKQKQKINLELEKAFNTLKSTQAQLIQSEKMASLGELTAGIAHEIQNPLNFVNNFSEVSTELVDEMNAEIEKGNLKDAKEIGNDLKQNLEKINHHGKRAGDIVKGMLQHSRSSSGVKEPTNINTLADEYLRLAYHGLRAKDKSFNATMKTDFDENIGNINIIPQDIGRVILNLITNAFYVVNEKAKQSIVGYEPTVTVSTHYSLSYGEGRGEVIIKVKDNGNGIPDSIKEKIFQPFFTTKPTGQGTGLGLSLSYDIVKAHGGELRVETKEREGSEFIIQLLTD